MYLLISEKRLALYRIHFPLPAGLLLCIYFFPLTILLPAQGFNYQRLECTPETVVSCESLSSFCARIDVYNDDSLYF